jgi:hypothetical protein
LSLFNPRNEKSVAKGDSLTIRQYHLPLASKIDIAGIEEDKRQTIGLVAFTDKGIGAHLDLTIIPVDADGAFIERKSILGKLTTHRILGLCVSEDGLTETPGFDFLDMKAISDSACSQLLKQLIFYGRNGVVRLGLRSGQGGCYEQSDEH